MSLLSSKLSYRVTEVSFRREVVDSVKKVFGLGIGKGYYHIVTVTFNVISIHVN